jgi:hypothetical protein
MDSRKKPDIEALIREVTPVTEAIRRGSLAAMKRHIQAGVPMVAFRDGKIVDIPPEELAEMLASAEKEPPGREP